MTSFHYLAKWKPSLGDMSHSREMTQIINLHVNDCESALNKMSNQIQKTRPHVKAGYSHSVIRDFLCAVLKAPLFGSQMLFYLCFLFLLKSARADWGSSLSTSVGSTLVCSGLRLPDDSCCSLILWMEAKREIVSPCRENSQSSHGDHTANAILFSSFQSPLPVRSRAAFWTEDNPRSALLARLMINTLHLSASRLLLLASAEPPPPPLSTNTNAPTLRL